MKQHNNIRWSRRQFVTTVTNKLNLKSSRNYDTATCTEMNKQTHSKWQLLLKWYTTNSSLWKSCRFQFSVSLECHLDRLVSFVLRIGCLRGACRFLQDCLFRFCSFHYFLTVWCTELFDRRWFLSLCQQAVLCSYHSVLDSCKHNTNVIGLVEISATQRGKYTS